MTSKTENQIETSEEPTIVTLAQYLKDLSFENPFAPSVFQELRQNGQYSMNVHVSCEKLEETTHEVNLKLEGKTEQDNKVIYAFELLYSGVFCLKNIPDEALRHTLVNSCPQLLFPFARQIIASITQSGGFPPLYIHAIDFSKLDFESNPE